MARTRHEEQNAIDRCHSVGGVIANERGTEVSLDLGIGGSNKTWYCFVGGSAITVWQP